MESWVNTKVTTPCGRTELRNVFRNTRNLVFVGVFFSIFVNVLMLSGPLYMLQIYDRVLGSRSEATLLALSLILAFLFLSLGIIDYARGRILSRIGSKIQSDLDKRVFSAALRRSSVFPNDPLALSAQRDLQAIQQFWNSNVATALMDIPWTPVFLAAIFIFHPLLGWVSLFGGSVLIAIALLNQQISRQPSLKANADIVGAERMADRLKADSEVLRALGMMQSAFARWYNLRSNALLSGIIASDLSGKFSSITRTLRMILQSAILGIGAWLVLEDELTAGAMIAGSILMGRALAPIEQAIGQWSVWTRSREGRSNLEKLLSLQPEEPKRTKLPPPSAKLEVENIAVVLPKNGSPIIRGVSLTLGPGQALGIIGSTGAGKTTLGRAMIGALRLSSGKIRLDGADLDQYEPEALGSYIGYLPQAVSIFDATVTENISRLSPSPDDKKVVSAAIAAGAHETILKLPNGYDTQLAAIGGSLSGGQIQRIGLARALYGDPILLVLDEPNSNLDNDGSLALNRAIRQMKARDGSVVVIAHRPAAIQECDLLLVLEDGVRRAFGPRDEILKGLVKNHSKIVRHQTQGDIK